jgi:predicted dehydrogenase
MGNSRRTFLNVTAALAAAGMAEQAEAQSGSANDTIEVGIIGCGIMGSGDGDTVHALPGAKVVAVADIYEGRLTAAKERYGAGIFTTRDYRELLAKPNIDAVIVATPDHWHAKIAVEALNAGKDVYCQKPMVQKVQDGLAVVQAAKDKDRILQVGSQGLSGIIHAKAKELIKQGVIGKVNLIQMSDDRNSSLGAWQYVIPEDASTSTVDWDRFIGSAPKRGFEPIRLFRWRNYRDYGTGIAGDLFVHQFSSIHFVMNSLGPERIVASGGLHFWKDGRDVPDVHIALCDYPETERHPMFHVQTGVNFVSGGAGATGGRGFRFIGSEGVLLMDGERQVSVVRKSAQATDFRYDYSPLPKGMRDKLFAAVPKPPQGIDDRSEMRFQAPAGYSVQVVHHMNWLNSIRTRQQPVEDAAYGLRAAAPPLLANKSLWENRIIRWDPLSMTEKTS